MGRRPTHKPATCPWAAMAERGLIPRSMAYHYRNGTGAPGSTRIALLHALGYHVSITPEGRAACDEWPEKDGGVKPPLAT